MNIKLNQNANKAFLRGDALSDADLRNLKAFYDDAVGVLRQLGSEFGLAEKECYARLRTIDQYREARKEKY